MKQNAVIYFIGIDGSGKSTLSEHLRCELLKMDLQASVTWWLKGEESLIRRTLRAIGESRFGGLAGNPIDVQSSVKTRQSLPRIIGELYFTLVILDYLRFGITKMCVSRIFRRKVILIFDRSIYDVVSSLAKEFGVSDPRRAMIMRICVRILPRPDIVFFVDVPPEIAFSRRASEMISLENAEVLHREYEELNSSLRSLFGCRVITIDNTRDIHTVNEEILNSVKVLLR